MPGRSLALLLPCLLASFLAVAAPAAPAAPVDPDRALGQRLDARLAAAEGLHDVQATVRDGRVVLLGEVVTAEERERATRVATQTQGVGEVDNRIRLSPRLSDRFEAVFQGMYDKMLWLLTQAPLVVIALLIVLLAAWLGGRASRVPVLRRVRSSNPYMDGLIRRTLRWVIVLAGILLALDLLGATALVGALLGSAGVVGLVLGFAFRDIAENYIAGVLLSLRRPFSPGDHLVVENREGKVVALTARATILMTLDGSQVSLPNALVFKSVILNYSANPKRRFEFTVTIDVAQSIRAAQALALEQIAKVEGVLEDPAPSSLVHDFAPTGIVLRYFGWIDQRVSDFQKTRGEAIRAVKAAYEKAEIPPPKTTTHIVMDRQPAATPKLEPATGPSADTSVNRDMDQQLAAAQDARDDDLLDGAKASAKQETAKPAGTG